MLQSAENSTYIMDESFSSGKERKGEENSNGESA